jgi:hypothetical protein
MRCSTRRDPSPPPVPSAQYGAFAAKVAKRYSPKGFSTFEIWNEPNDAQAKPLAGG